MRKLILLFLIATFAMALFPPSAIATISTTVETVRRMCTAPDNQDFSIFDQELLPGVLIEIIENDPEDAEYHDRVVSSALKVLGGLHVPEAVDVLVGKIDEYPYPCLHWLGTYTTVESIAAIIEYLDDEDASLRYEAADALVRLPRLDEYDEDLQSVLIEARDRIAEQMQIEDDEAVLGMLELAEVMIGDQESRAQMRVAR